MPIMLFHFVFVIFYNRAPEQAAGSAPAIEDDSVLEWLVTRGDHQAIVLARGVIVRHAPVKNQGPGLEFFQTRTDILCPMAAPPTFSRADVHKEGLELRV